MRGEWAGNCSSRKGKSMRILVLDKNLKPLMPCTPYRARKLLDQGKARVYRRYPFTIVLVEREKGDLQEVELKIDPGSKITGIAIVAHFNRGHVLVWAANLKHRGDRIRQSLEKRRSVRRNRRSRKTRYRQPRFNNRRRKKGWIPPSLKSRVDNVRHWAKKLQKFAPLTHIEIETVRFDTQKLQNPEITGIEYQQGELFGYEVREYLLEKWQRNCAYCGRENVPLQVEHIVPKGKGGSNRVSNLTLSCNGCNRRKGTKDIRDFLARDPKRLAKIFKQAKISLKDTAAVNATRYAIGNDLKILGLPVGFSTGSRTKYNRRKQGYQKDHWIDATCVGKTGEKVFIPEHFCPLTIEAKGRGTRQVCRVEKNGFPRTRAKRNKRIHGFETGDLVQARVTKGKKTGYYKGRVAIRASGNFNITTSYGVIQGISYKFCRKIHCCDGYSYG